MRNALISLQVKQQVIMDLEVPVNMKVNKLVDILCVEIGADRRSYSKLLLVTQKKALTGEQTLEDLKDGMIVELIH